MFAFPSTIHLASKSEVKKAALLCHPNITNVITHDVESGVNSQPIGIEEIRKGCKNRLDAVHNLPKVAVESGLVKVDNEWFECNVMMFHGRFGSRTLEEKFKIDENILECKVSEYMEKCDPSEMSFGQYIKSSEPEINFKPKWPIDVDWYRLCFRPTRETVISSMFYSIMKRYELRCRTFPESNLVCDKVEYKSVTYLDIQSILLKGNQNRLFEIMNRLLDGLVYDTVMVADARGFLFASLFIGKDVNIVMARKPGKLPGNVLTKQYRKEYGTDSICIQSGLIDASSRVIILDDVIATGGTMKAMAELVTDSGGKVVKFIAPYIVKVNGEFMCGEMINNVVTYMTSEEIDFIESLSTPIPKSSESDIGMSDIVAIVPPSYTSMYQQFPVLHVKWGKYAYSPNTWFNSKHVFGRTVLVYINTSEPEEMIQVLNLLHILKRKQAEKVIIVCPFIDQSTQDRVEHDGEMESIAAMDTLNVLFGKHIVVTFDIHCLQSFTAYHNMIHTSVVEKMWDKFYAGTDFIPVFPDDGAAKRYSRIKSNTGKRIVFQKMRDGDKRHLYTNDIIKEECNYVVIDDIIRSGGTMSECGKYLKQRCNGDVNCLVAHTPLEPKAAARMDIFDAIYTSDSCPRTTPSEWVKFETSPLIEDMVIM